MVDILEREDVVDKRVGKREKGMMKKGEEPGITWMGFWIRKAMGILRVLGNMNRLVGYRMIGAITGAIKSR